MGKSAVPVAIENIFEVITQGSRHGWYSVLKDKANASRGGEIITRPIRGAYIGYTIGDHVLVVIDTSVRNLCLILIRGHNKATL